MPLAEPPSGELSTGDPVAAAAGLPPAPLQEAPAALRSWLRRLHETASDLSRRVADQEARLDHLTRLLEAAGEKTAAAAPVHQLASPPAAPNGSRWRRLAGRLLRAPGTVLRRFRAAAQSRWILPVADDKNPPPRLRLGEEVLSVELNGRVQDLPPGFLDLALRVLASEELFFVELRGRVEGAGEDFELWLWRREWPWRRLADLGRKIDRLPAGGPLLGRRCVLDGDPHAGRAPAALDGFEVRGEYWLRPGAPAGIEHRARTGRPPGAAPEEPIPGKTAILATRPLDGGLEVLVAALIRLLKGRGNPVVLAATCDLRASHRSLAEVAPREVTLYPLAVFSPPELRGSLLARVFESERVATIFHLGPGEGFFDQPALQDLLRRVAVIDLPLPFLPGSPIAARPPGVVAKTLSLEANGSGLPLPVELLPSASDLSPLPPSPRTERGETPLGGDTPLHPPFLARNAERSPLSPEGNPLGRNVEGSKPSTEGNPLGRNAEGSSGLREAARERLGLPRDGFVACQMADLIPGERPEDLVELASRHPDVFFLQVGRGGLAGRRDDLLRFRGVRNVRCLSSADLGEVLAAADAMLALGDPSLWPWPIFAALSAGVPVAGRTSGVLARLEGGIAGGASLAEIAAALGRLLAGEAPVTLPPPPPEDPRRNFDAALSELLAG